MIKKIFFALIALLFIIPSIFSQTVYSKTQVILFGASDYDSDNLRDLPGPVHDMENIRDMLVNGGVDSHDIITLTGDQATTENIGAAVDMVAPLLTPQDSVSIYWSGHGGPGTLYTKDGSITNEQLRNMLQKLKVENIDLFLDVCHACSIDFKDLPDRNTTILGAVGKDDSAYENVIYEPGAPPEVKGIGSFLLTQADAKQQGASYKRGDKNRDGSVSMDEKMNFMNNYGSVQAGLDLIKQTACMKKHDARDKMPPGAKWKGLITFDENSNMSFSADLGIGSSKGEGTSSQHYELSFWLSEDKADSTRDRRVYKVSKGNFAYNVSASTSGSGGMSAADPNVFVAGGSRTDTQKGSDRIALEPDSVKLVVDDKVGWYMIEINSPVCLIVATHQSRGGMQLMGKGEDKSENTKEDMKCSVEFKYADRWTKGAKSIKGGRGWTTKQIAETMQKFMQEASKSLYFKPGIDFFILDCEMTSKYQKPPGVLGGVYYGQFENAGQIGHGSGLVEAKWDLTATG